MPSTSDKQRRFMAAAAHSPEFAKKAGIPQSVAQGFNQADKGKTFGVGENKKAKLNNPNPDRGQAAFFKKGGEMKESKAGGSCKTEAKKEVKAHEKRLHGMKAGGRIASKGEHAVQKQAKRGAQMIKMCGGGMAKKKTGRGR